MKNKIKYYIILSLLYPLSQYCLFCKFKNLDNIEKKCGIVQYCETTNLIYHSDKLYVLYDGVETVEEIRPGSCRLYSIGDEVCFNKKTYNILEWMIYGLLSLIGLLLNGAIFILILQFLLNVISQN